MADGLMKDLGKMRNMIKGYQSYTRDINNLECLIDRFRTKEGIRETIDEIDSIVKKKLLEKGHFQFTTEIGVAYELYTLSNSSREQYNFYKGNDRLRTVFDGLSRITRLMYLAYLSKVK